MSATHAAGHHDAHDAHDDVGYHATVKGYVTGFILSVVLTAVPFWLVMGDVLDDTLRTSIVIMALAAVQIVVHMIYFLHMNTKSEGGWTFLALVFTLILVVITLVGGDQPEPAHLDHQGDEPDDAEGDVQPVRPHQHVE